MYTATETARALDSILSDTEDDGTASVRHRMSLRGWRHIGLLFGAGVHGWRVTFRRDEWFLDGEGDTPEAAYRSAWEKAGWADDTGSTELERTMNLRRASDE